MRIARFGRRNCNVNLDDLDWNRPDLGCEPPQARRIRRNLQLDETLLLLLRGAAAMAVLLLLVMGGVMVAVPSQTDLNQAEGGRECHFERFMQAA